jgi:hypothetical protein
MLAENDLVAARWTASGTHTGSWGGLAPGESQLGSDSVRSARSRARRSSRQVRLRRS